MLEFHVYILRCSDSSYYIGHTDNIEARISAHEQGLIPTCYTFTRRPIEVAWQGTFATRYDALSFERQIKRWSRRKKEALINNELHLLKFLAMNTKRKTS